MQTLQEDVGKGASNRDQEDVAFREKRAATGPHSTLALARATSTQREDDRLVIRRLGLLIDVEVDRS
jgi:hypothetical protein